MSPFLYSLAWPNCPVGFTTSRNTKESYFPASGSGHFNRKQIIGSSWAYLFAVSGTRAIPFVIFMSFMVFLDYLPPDLTPHPLANSIKASNIILSWEIFTLFLLTSCLLIKSQSIHADYSVSFCLFSPLWWHHSYTAKGVIQKTNIIVSNYLESSKLHTCHLSFGNGKWMLARKNIKSGFHFCFCI